jgi:hypothetical protein
MVESAGHAPEDLHLKDAQWCRGLFTMRKGNSRGPRSARGTNHVALAHGTRRRSAPELDQSRPVSLMRTTWRSAWPYVVGVVLVLNISWFAPQTSASAAQSSSLGTAKKQYLAAVGPLNAAAAVFYDAAHVNEYSGNLTGTTEAEVVATAGPYLVALQRFRSSLLKETWPTSVQHAVQAEVKALGGPIRDMKIIRRRPLSIGEYAGAIGDYLNPEGYTFGQAAEALREDLGLPPPPAIAAIK